ncbi:MAG: dihydropteroate synthase [Chloroflexota bacterium]
MPKQTQIGKHHFHWGSQTYVMGIINVTPDSFSGDGIYQDKAKVVDRSVRQATNFVEHGAHLLDVGGESTRPGAEQVNDHDEIARVIPVIEALVDAVDVPISIDTYKADVAKAALDAGASLVNDIWGLQKNRDMASLCAQRGIPIILMHNRSQPDFVSKTEDLGGRYVETEYENLLDDVATELQQSVDIAKQAGISDHNIILDPGIGFGKTVDQNLILTHNLHHFKSLGYPLLFGPSNKSFIGYTLNLPPEDRLEGTASAIAVGIDRGADIIRVHHVKAMSRVARMTDAIVRS